MTAKVSTSDAVGWEEPSRVARYLARAEPCSHRYVHLAGGYLVCEECQRIQRRDAALCLVCDDPGAVAAQLLSVNEPDVSCSGRLCVACLQEFRERGEIDGWVAEVGPGGDGQRSRVV